MIKARKSWYGHWTANYRDHDGFWRIARDARGLPLECANESLALSVARYRRRRLRRWH